MKSWKADTDCCSWDGITCDTENGHVVVINLSNSWLSGTLKSNSSLFNLRHLQKLNLALNDFSSSTIPSQFGQLWVNAEFGGYWVKFRFWGLLIEVEGVLAMEIGASAGPTLAMEIGASAPRIEWLGQRR
uniref:Leucine-rich repeat-containing N-terminal plant-type domain-containing protein n=1 Tax=Fagus sylvatica TaxID=28930 RepID=A0A2N9EFS1_FAGSY